MPELTVRVPVALVGDVGEPLGAEVVAVIRSLEVLNYWPLDFGEATNEYVELCFIQGTEPAMVKRVTDYFIKRDGDV